MSESGFMRLFIALITVTLALPAAAQYPAAMNSNSSTPPAASADITNKPTEVPQKPKDEVGYDAKVKRDPYGKIINDGKSPGAKTEDAPPLRNDKNLRGDSEILKR